MKSPIPNPKSAAARALPSAIGHLHSTGLPPLLLAHFDRVAEAPDAIPRLRQFILDLAVRGKLVPQDPKDEPVSSLLASLAAAAALSAQASKSPPPKPLSPLPPAAEPFQLPTSWQWVRMGNIGDTNIGLTYSPQDLSDRGVPVLRSNNIQAGKLTLCDLVRVDTDVKESVLVHEGDLLICARNGSRALVGKTAIIPRLHEKTAFGAFMAVFRSPLNPYLYHFISSPVFRQVIAEVNTTTINQITQNNLRTTPLPLPPLAEQHRIVAKVDELMALCDRLEAAQPERESRHTRLVAATHAQLVAPQPREGGPTFFINTLPRLTARPTDIPHLRQTILSLAVRGKLVPQDRNDESAHEFLTQIRAEKVRLQKEGKLRGGTSVRVLEPDEDLPAIPSTWAWVPFGDIIFSRDGDRIPVSKEERNIRAKTHDYYGASGVIDKIDGYLFDKPLLLIGEDGANLINRSTPIAFIARGKYWVNNHAHVLDGITEGFLRFIELHINAIDLKPYVTGTAQPKMNQAKMNSIPIALPPEAEQHRIVTKVDELMALCDRLEAQLTTTQTQSRCLLEATLHQALNGKP